MPRLLSLKRCLSRLDELSGRLIRVRGVWGAGPAVYVSLDDVAARDRSKALQVIAPDGERLMFYRPGVIGCRHEPVKQDICCNNECEIEAIVGDATARGFPAALLDVKYLFIDTPIEPDTCHKCGKAYTKVRQQTRTLYLRHANGRRRPWKRYSSHCPHCNARVAVSA